MYSATAILLRPIVRMLLRHGISHSEFVEISKRAYVDVAYSEFKIPGRKKTVSRAAVITGLSRKEVLRLTMQEDVELPRKGSINRANKVINGWLTNKEFLDQENNPLVMELIGDRASFSSLVKQYSGDITARAVLDELIRVGSAEKVADQKVKLLTKGYLPNNDEAEKIRIMGNCSSDFLNTIDHNISSNTEDLYFQRQVAYSHLPESAIPKFRELSHKKSTELLVELNHWLAERDVIANPDAEGAGEVRAGLGIYYFEDEKNENMEVT